MPQVLAGLIMFVLGVLFARAFIRDFLQSPPAAFFDYVWDRVRDRTPTVVVSITLILVGGLLIFSSINEFHTP